MKKLISLALAIVMMMCLSTTAFAATVEAPGDYTAKVTGSYVAGYESNGIVYCVDITWNDLDFTYHAEKGAVWNTETLTYSQAEPAYWEGEGSITVTNRSNTKISAKPTYTSADGYGDAGMDFSTSDLSVASAESGTAQTGTITVTPNGFLPAMDKADTIGTITLTIAQGNITLEEANILQNQVDSLIDDAVGKGMNTNEGEFAVLREASSNLETWIVDITYGDYEVIPESIQNLLNTSYQETLIAYNICAALMDA